MAKKKGVLAAVVGAILIATSIAAAPPANAAQKTAALAGTVNCNGSVTQYGTTRYLTGYSSTYLYVSKAAYYDGGWFWGTSTSMMFGVHINRTGENFDQWVSGADRWATFSTGNYLPNTAFVMRAAMTNYGHGPCYNSWAGTLYY